MSGLGEADKSMSNHNVVSVWVIGEKNWFLETVVLPW